MSRAQTLPGITNTIDGFRKNPWKKTQKGCIKLNINGRMSDNDIPSHLVLQSSKPNMTMKNGPFEMFLLFKNWSPYFNSSTGI